MMDGGSVKINVWREKCHTYLTSSMSILPIETHFKNLIFQYFIFILFQPLPSFNAFIVSIRQIAVLLRLTDNRIWCFCLNFLRLKSFIFSLQIGSSGSQYSDCPLQSGHNTRHHWQHRNPHGFPRQQGDADYEEHLHCQPRYI